MRVLLGLISRAIERQAESNGPVICGNLICLLCRVSKRELPVPAFIEDLDHVQEIIGIHTLEVNGVDRNAERNLHDKIIW